MIHLPTLARTTSKILGGCIVLTACGSSASPATKLDAGVSVEASSGDAGAVHDALITTRDGGGAAEAGAARDGGMGAESSPGADASGATTTIAQARGANVTTAITVNAFVTALAGVSGDYPTWYVEDPAGGASSGVAVYCDPLVSTPCTVPEPALHDLIQVTGTLTTYKGQLQFLPTAMKVLQSNATPPPVASVTPAEIAPGGASQYRGVFVKVSLASKLTVDSVTPSALFDTGCGAVVADGGVAACSNLCEPPAYSGFQANDGAGHEIFVEAPFFSTDPLQSSPECLAQSGVVPVKVGTTFSEMSGILDYDGYAASQALSPVVPADYVTP